MNTTKFINRLSFWVLSKSWVTCLWLPVLLLAWVFIEPAFSWAGIKAAGVAAGLLFLAGLVIPQFWYAVPVLGDIWRAYQKRAVRRGREALAACELVSKSDAEYCKARLAANLWEFICPWAAGGDDAMVLVLIRKHLARFGARDFELLEHDDETGRWVIRFLKQPDMEAPIRQNYMLADFPKFSLDDCGIDYGIDDFGYKHRLILRSQPGMLAGGMPSSGKTSGAQVIVGSLLASPNAEVHIIDGKGGADWSWAKRSAKTFISGTGGLNQVINLLEDLVQEMEHRQETMLERYGVPAFWDTIPDPTCPVLCLVIDECQTLFDTRGASKEDKGKLERITALVADLVKRGRSAGVFLMLMTQKPTADAIPTAIRDNIGIRACFRVATREAEQAVLGYPAENTLSLAYTIPSDNPGQAVVLEDDGLRHNVKFYYVPQYVLTRFAEQAEQAAEEEVAL